MNILAVIKMGKIFFEKKKKSLQKGAFFCGTKHFILSIINIVSPLDNRFIILVKLSQHIFIAYFDIRIINRLSLIFIQFVQCSSF